VGNDSAYLSFTGGSLSIKVSSFKVESAITSALGSFKVSTNGTIDSQIEPVTITTTAGSSGTTGTINHANSLALQTAGTTRATVSATGISIPYGHYLGVGGAVDSSYSIRAYGAAKIDGNLTAIGLAGIGGVADAAYRLRVYGNAIVDNGVLSVVEAVDSVPIEARGKSVSGGQSVAMAFHIPNVYASYLKLTSDGYFHLGGWSAPEDGAGLKCGSIVTSGKVAIGGAINDVYHLYVYGHSMFAGNITSTAEIAAITNIRAFGTIAAGGATDAAYKLRAYGAAKIDGALTVAGTLTPKGPTDTTSLTSTAANSAIIGGGVTVATDGAWHYIPMATQGAKTASGWECKTTIGALKLGSNAYTNGFFIGLGGNDNDPTEAFLFKSGGRIDHSGGNIGIGMAPESGVTLRVLYRLKADEIVSATWMQTTSYISAGADISAGTYLRTNRGRTVVLNSSTEQSALTIKVNGVTRYIRLYSGTEAAGSDAISPVTIGEA
jgi:hypothetical protein